MFYTSLESGDGHGVSSVSGGSVSTNWSDAGVSNSSVSDHGVSSYRHSSGHMGDTVLHMSPLYRHWNSNILSQGCLECLGDLLDCVGSSLVDQRLVDSLVSSDWTRDLLGSERGDVLEDRLGYVMGLHNGIRLVHSDGAGNVGVGRLRHRVGQGGDLRGHRGIGVTLSSGVREIASQSVMLDGSTVMSRSSN